MAIGAPRPWFSSARSRAGKRRKIRHAAVALGHSKHRVPGRHMGPPKHESCPWGHPSHLKITASGIFWMFHPPESTDPGRQQEGAPGNKSVQLQLRYRADSKSRSSSSSGSNRSGSSNSNPQQPAAPAPAAATRSSSNQHQHQHQQQQHQQQQRRRRQRLQWFGGSEGVSWRASSLGFQKTR